MRALAWALWMCWVRAREMLRPSVWLAHTVGLSLAVVSSVLVVVALCLAEAVGSRAVGACVSWVMALEACGGRRRCTAGVSGSGAVLGPQRKR